MKCRCSHIFNHYGHIEPPGLVSWVYRLACKHAVHTIEKGCRISLYRWIIFKAAYFIRRLKEDLE